ncbi:MAG: DUF1003 domain-containing protein [Deltaproteobacteria bacterium]|nr:DUF1003 domain-containing protein [Deltaproteobacteria bacterium]
MATQSLAHDPITCPTCGGVNPSDAVFCDNPACHKALGEFRYVKEELLSEARWYETLADRISDFIAKPHFLVAHSLWFVIWVAMNTGVLAIAQRFDEYPFGLLGIILAVEAIFITGFLLMSNNRQSAHANKRAELDYEVNVRTYRLINKADAVLSTVVERLERLEATLVTDTREQNKP